MERSLRLFSSLVLLLLLVTSSEMGAIRGVEGRSCESQSNKFKGTCVRQANCAAVCQTEGFPSGDCRGLRRRCFCSKPC